MSTIAAALFMTAAMPSHAADAPDSLDWRSKGAVTPVKDMQHCPDHGEASRTDALEGAWAIQGNPLTTFQPRPVEDPDARWECDLIVEEISPTPFPRERIEGWNSVGAGERALRDAVAEHGPTVAYVDGSGYEYQLYSEGLFAGHCGTANNVAVTVVGYGTTAQGQKYWIVKSTWGESWGEGGYMRIIRGENKCGIEEGYETTYPTLKSSR
ncbi:C1 family peptidase [Streptomyces sp. cg35]|uniref:C1 family peptidase n=1 Tax=Streptomyces sp. cg35 TaxID=3421650 RepID=UPI003D181754